LHIIKQGQNEQITQFVDRLYKAIETHPDLTGDMKTKMFQLLAFDNASERSKQILGSLPRSAQVADMVELMERTQQTKYAACVAAAVQGAIAPLLHKNREKRNLEKWCFRCGKVRQPVNIVLDSLYVVGVVLRLECAMLKEVSNRHLYKML